MLCNMCWFLYIVLYYTFICHHWYCPSHLLLHPAVRRRLEEVSCFDIHGLVGCRRGGLDGGVEHCRGVEMISWMGLVKHRQFNIPHMWFTYQTCKLGSSSSQPWKVNKNLYSFLFFTWQVAPWCPLVFKKAETRSFIKNNECGKHSFYKYILKLGST